MLLDKAFTLPGGVFQNAVLYEFGPYFSFHQCVHTRCVEISAHNVLPSLWQERQFCLQATVTLFDSIVNRTLTSTRMEMSTHTPERRFPLYKLLSNNRLVCLYAFDPANVAPLCIAKFGAVSFFIITISLIDKP
jgi:hypothetical protein